MWGRGLPGIECAPVSAVQGQLTIQLPDWVLRHFSQAESAYTSIESRMALAIELAGLNVEHGSGGPFGAAIFDMDSHALIATGINLVMHAHCSMAHAEMVAISMAQQQQGNVDLGRNGQRYELVSSCAPCAMCLGAIPWSGICQLSCGARDEDARAIGFDEGSKPDDWQQGLISRGINVRTDICRQQAADVLQRYAARNGMIY